MRIEYVTESHSILIGGDDKATIDVVTPKELNKHLESKADESDLRALEKQVDKAEEHVADLAREHKELSRFTRNQLGDNKGGLIHEVTLLSDSVDKHAAKAKAEIEQLEERLKKGLAKTTGIEDRLRTAVENGEWRSVFRKEVEAYVRALEEMLAMVATKSEEARAEAHSSLAEIGLIEKRIEDHIASFKAEISHLIQEEGAKCLSALLEDAKDRLRQQADARSERCQVERCASILDRRTRIRDILVVIAAITALLLAFATWWQQTKGI